MLPPTGTQPFPNRAGESHARWETGVSRSRDLAFLSFRVNPARFLSRLSVKFALDFKFKFAACSGPLRPGIAAPPGQSIYPLVSAARSVA